jgi:hypothetical protein
VLGLAGLTAEVIPLDLIRAGSECRTTITVLILIVAQQPAKPKTLSGRRLERAQLNKGQIAGPLVLILRAACESALLAARASRKPLASSKL